MVGVGVVEEVVVAEEEVEVEVGEMVVEAVAMVTALMMTLCGREPLSLHSSRAASASYRAGHTSAPSTRSWSKSNTNCSL
jgi:hypothetical protein